MMEMKEDEKKPGKTADPAEASAETVPADSAAETETPESHVEEENNETTHFSKIYSNVASNRYENLRTSYIENKAKELRKKRK